MLAEDLKYELSVFGSSEKSKAAKHESCEEIVDTFSSILRLFLSTML